MATTKQRAVARSNIRKAQAAWRDMSKRQHSIAQPEGPGRKRPGTRGGGKFYRIEVRPKQEFITFRTHDIGDKGHLERIAGKRSSGSWDTATWLVSKNDAHREGDRLVIDNPKVRSSLIGKKQVRGEIMHKKGDVFEAKPRRNIPEHEKPTRARRTAQQGNIKKAQAARRRK